jgi:hypothetical protein
MPFRPQAPLNIRAAPWLGRSPNSKEPLAARQSRRLTSSGKAVASEPWKENQKLTD